MKKKDFKVELIRIIACMAVIWYHIRRLPFKADGSLSETAVFFECVCTICVMTFFLITGFFIYDKKGDIIHDWLTLIKSFFRRVFPPFLIAIVVSLIFHDYFISTKTIVECLKSFDILYIFKEIFTSFISLSVNNLPGTCGHLWYVYAYFFIILFYPITRLFLTKLPKCLVYTILLVFLFLMIVNDYYLFFDNPSFNFVFEIIKKPVIYSAFGHVLYNNFIKKYVYCFNIKVFTLSVLLYIIIFVLLFKTQVAYDLTTNGDYVYTAWLSTYSLIITIAFILIVYSIPFERIVSDRYKNIVYYISNKTYLIYIIHYFIITKFLTIKFQGIFFDNLKYFVQHLLYHILYGMFIFIITLACVLLIEFVVDKTDKFCRRFIWQKEKTI